MAKINFTFKSLPNSFKENCHMYSYHSTQNIYDVNYHRSRTYLEDQFFAMKSLA